MTEAQKPAETHKPVEAHKDAHKATPASKPGEVPKTGAELIRRLKASGTGMAKVQALADRLHALTEKAKKAVTAEELYESACGDPLADPPVEPCCPRETLAKARLLLDTGEATRSTDNPVDIDLEAKLALMETGKTEPPPPPVAHAEPGKPAPRVQRPNAPTA